MTHLRITLVALLSICAVCKLVAQPAITPAPNYQWVMTGTGTYTSPTVGTVPGGVGANTGYGQPGDSDPASCATYCGGNCDGDGVLQNIVFGSVAFPSASCEQRAVALDHWNNPNPESAISNGASAGTVYLPADGAVNILSSGTGAGGGNNRAWIIGGNSGGNSVFTTEVDYSLNWHVPTYGLSDGSGNQDYDFTWNWGEPGGGAETETSGWNNFTRDGFGMSFNDALAVPASSIIETGGTFEVIFEANSSISISRVNGGADGRVEHNPGMEGSANYIVNYDIWELEIILPVEFNYIEARQVDREIVLSWQTAIEINAANFEVQRSTNSGDWKTIGAVVAAGNTDSNTDYQFVDEDLSSGVLRYRLLQVDLDGQTSYSPTAHVKVEIDDSPLQLYPTTADHQITVVGFGDAERHYNIVDINGRKWQSGDVTSGQSIDIVQLPTGVFFIRIIEDNGATSQSLRFIKM